jgi:hypothetical protein
MNGAAIAIELEFDRPVPANDEADPSAALRIGETAAAAARAIGAGLVDLGAMEALQR